MSRQRKKVEFCICKILTLASSLLYQAVNGIESKSDMKMCFCDSLEPSFLCKLIRKSKVKNVSRTSFNNTAIFKRDRVSNNRSFSHQTNFVDLSRIKKFNFLETSEKKITSNSFKISPLINVELQLSSWSKAASHSNFDASRILDLTLARFKSPRADCSSNKILLDNQKSNLVAAHNRERRRVAPPAANMRLMTWDDELASLAARRTEACKFKEPEFFMQWNDALFAESIERHLVLNAEVGFNWFAWGNSGSLPVNFVSDAVSGWMKEGIYYDHDLQTCSSICRHYLQVVWAQTYKIGCATSCCSIYDINGVIWRSTTMLVCAYTPRGNVLEFQLSPSLAGSYSSPFKTRPPYLHGAGCKLCKEDLDDVEPRTPHSLASRLYHKLKRTTFQDFCDDLLCANNERDRIIPFNQRPYSTTTFAWASAVIVTSSPFVSTLGNSNPSNTSNTAVSGSKRIIASLWTLAAAFFCFLSS